MNIRLFEDKDYSVICSWWKEHEWPILPKASLPKLGLVVDNVCAGFIYQTDSNIAWLEFLISNPNTPKELRSDSLDVLINEAKQISKELGFKLLFSSVSHPSLVEKYKKHKFKETDLNMTNFMCLLENN